MAKVTEGNPYYYTPYTNSPNSYSIRCRDRHPNDVVVEQVDQDNASLIVDALNHFYASHPASYWNAQDGSKK